MKYKILIVDDSFSFRGLLRNTIKQSHDICELVGEAKNGQEAVQKYEELQPDIVTMDLSMPVKNGVDATKEILAINPKTNIIVVTGTTDETLVQKVEELGIKHIIRKPFQSNTLIAAIKELMSEEGAVIQEETFEFVTPSFTKVEQSTQDKILDGEFKEIEKPSVIDKSVTSKSSTTVPTLGTERDTKIISPKQTMPVIEQVEPVVNEIQNDNVYVPPTKTIKHPLDDIYDVKIVKEHSSTVETGNSSSETIVIDNKNDNVSTYPSIRNESDKSDDNHVPTFIKPTTSPLKKDEDDDEYTPPSFSVESKEGAIEKEDEDDDDDDVPSFENTQFSQIPEVVKKVENVENEKEESVIEDNILVETKVQNDSIKEIKEETISVENEKSNLDVYVPPTKRTDTVFRPIEKHKEEVKNVYEPMKVKSDEDIIPLPNIGQNVFVPQYDDKNAFELKGVSEKLQKPIHWEEDTNESGGVDEMTMVLPGQEKQSSTPQVVPVPLKANPIQGDRLPPTNPPNMVSRPAPRLPDNIPSQPPRPPVKDNPNYPPQNQNVHHGHAGNYGRSQQTLPDPRASQYPVGPPQIREPAAQRNNEPLAPRNQNSYMEQPPAPPRQQRMLDSQTDDNLETKEGKKKGGIFGFLSGLFKRKK